MTEVIFAGEAFDTSPCGRYRTVAEYDVCVYDDSYIDTWDDCSEEEKEKHRKALWDQIEEHGVWVVSLQRKCCECGTWIDEESVGGIVPDYEYTLRVAAGDHGLLASEHAQHVTSH